MSTDQQLNEFFQSFDLDEWYRAQENHPDGWDALIEQPQHNAQNFLERTPFFSLGFCML
jgi:hypothetical protein